MRVIVAVVTGLTAPVGIASPDDGSGRVFVDDEPGQIPAVHDFGWSCKEADSTYNAAECGGRKITYPVHVIPHRPGGNCAVIGGYVYRGKTYAAVAGGLYLYTDNCSGRVWGLGKINGKWVNAQIGSLSGGPTAMGVDQAGNEYAVTLGGDLYRASFTKS